MPSRSAFPGLDLGIHVVSLREEAVISTDCHKGSKEADGPQDHEDDPCDEEWAKLRDAENL